MISYPGYGGATVPRGLGATGIGNSLGFTLTVHPGTSWMDTSPPYGRIVIRTGCRWGYEHYDVTAPVSLMSHGVPLTGEGRPQQRAGSAVLRTPPIYHSQPRLPGSSL
jgi:hypothetical protein